MYHRDLLKVEFPQLEQVRTKQPKELFHSSRRMYGNRKNQHSPEPFCPEDSHKSSEKPVQHQSLTPSRLANYSPGSSSPSIHLRIRHMRQELQRKNHQIQRLLFLQNLQLPPLEEPFAKVKALTPVPCGGKERKTGLAEYGNRLMTPGKR